MRPISALIVFLCLAAPARGQEPLSAIDWLQEPFPATVVQPRNPQTGPPVAEEVETPAVTVVPLGETRPDAVGLLPGSTTGLPSDLWQAGREGSVVAALERLDGSPLPAMQALYYTLLLAEADPPADAGPDASFLKARIGALRRFGAVNPALALLDRAGPARPALFDPWLDLALLDGEEGRPCRVLAARPRLSDSYAKRVYCTARAGEWATAAVIYDSAVALDLLSDRQADLLAQFLDPETVGRSPGLAPPQEVTPLLFRLYEAAGSPLPTGNLPRAFAVADLRPTAGWKVRLDAAERLARTGALPANRLLGLYTEREPPASGGVWERAAAVQALDKALSKNDAETVARVLPGAWADMRRQNLATPFAEIFGTRLARIALEGPARAAAFRAALLSPEYEAAIAAFVPQTRAERFLAGLARGTPPAQAARTPLEKAITAAFAASGPAPAQAPLLEAGKLGQAILAAGHQIDTAAPGQVARIRAGLQTLLAVGLEDTARRAALQLLILPARP